VCIRVRFPRRQDLRDVIEPEPELAVEQDLA
jgi:hypothetical protein